jgi:hypothetical protein|tara:strand:- start:2460 stop:2702 length:243 start_codon:yes stop_codon:yes gene_type:complete
MESTLEREIDMKYKYLMNLVPRARKKTKLPYSVEILDEKLTELEFTLHTIKPTASKQDINVVRNKINDIRSSITILIIGT